MLESNFRIDKNKIYLDLNKIDFNLKNTKFIMSKIINKYKWNRNLEFIVDDVDYLKNIDKYVLENIYQVLVLIETLKIKNKKLRHEYIYDKICFYLDSVCISKNLCDFQNNICFGKRGTTIENGCCHCYKSKIFIGLKEMPTLCKYHEGITCKAKSIGCKMFLCDEVTKEKNIKFTIENVLLIKYYYNWIQKLIIKMSVFHTKEEIIKALSRFGLR